MGYEYGDAQNIAVRCFLNQFSKNFQYFDEYYKNKTLEYCEWLDKINQYALKHGEEI